MGDFLTAINGGAVEGELQLWWVVDGGESYDYIVLNRENGGGVTEVQRSLSKSPIDVPIPFEDNVGFDIGFVEGDTYTINITSTEGISGLWDELLNLFKYKDGVDQGREYAFTMGTTLGNFVVMKQLSCSIEAGKGDIVGISITLGVVKEGL